MKLQKVQKQIFSHRVTHQEAISILFAVLAVFWFFVFFKYHDIQRVQLYGLKFVESNSGWYYKENGAKKYAKLPETIPVDADGFARLYYDVSFVQDTEFSIGFFTNNQIDIVSAGDEIIESYTGADFPEWLEVTGKYYHIVTVPQQLATGGKTICIATKSSVAGSSGSFSEIQKGTRSALLVYLVRHNFLRFILATLIFVLSLVLLGIAFIFHKQLGGDHTLRALGYLTILVGCWLLEETFVTQLFYSNPLVHWLFDYLFFITMPITFFYFVEELSGVHKDKGMGILTYVDIAIISLQMILQVFFRMTLPRTMIITHVFLLASFAYVVYFFIREIKQGNIRMKGYLHAVLILIVGSVVELFNYYFCKFETNDVLTLSFLFFFVYLGVQVYQKSLARMQELTDAATYRKLAFIDFSTGVYNRTAYYTYVEKYISRVPRKFCIVIFDMNNLKKINDHYGHLYGDKVIKTFSDCAQKSFGSLGKVYRIGGDEFLSLIREPANEQIQEACVRFEMCIAEQQEVQYKFTVAYGTCIFSAVSVDDFFIGQKTADANMYKMKALMKKEHRIEGFQKVTDIDSVPKDKEND